jgi:MFS family permease
VAGPSVGGALVALATAPLALLTDAASFLASAAWLRHVRVPAPAPLLLFAAEFGSGFGVMVLDISAGAILAAAVPDELRARVAGAYQLVNYGVRPLGALAGGVLGARLGLQPTLWLAAAGALASVLWLPRAPVMRLRTLPEAG